MANNFQIVISAVDRATATFKKVNAGMERLTRPTREMTERFAAFGKEAKTFAKFTGLDVVGKGLGRVANAAGDVARSLLSVAPPLAAIASFGTIAGIAELALSWGHVGTEIANTASVLGVSTDDLQRFRGAARLAGLSADDMTGGLRALGTTLEDATFGRNQQALVMMNKFGISLHRTKSGAVDATRALHDVANAIVAQGGNVEAQDLIAKTFGVEQLLPLLQKGGAGIDAFVAQAQKLGMVMTPEQIAAAQEYNNRLVALDLTLDNLKNTVGNALIPVLQPLLEQVTQWAVANKDLIATKVQDFVRDLTVELPKFITNVNNVVDSIGGWKTVAIATGLVMAGPLLSSVVSLGAGLIKLGALVWANPILAALGAIAFLTYEVINNMDKIGSSTADATPPAFGGGDSTSAPHWTGYDKFWNNIFGATSGPNNAANKPTAASNQLFTGLEHQYSLPQGLLDSVWKTESGRGANMQSRAGALGDFQFMPDTAKQYGLANPMDLNQSAGAAAHMYSDLLKANGGDLDRSLAAYNWGQGNLNKYGMGAAPQETKDYIARVKAAMAQHMMTNGADPTSLARLMASQGGSNGAGGPTIVSANQPGADGLEVDPVTGKVEVLVHLLNAPPGTQATTKTQGNVTTSTRIGYSTMTQVTP